MLIKRAPENSLSFGQSRTERPCDDYVVHSGMMTFSNKLLYGKKLCILNQISLNFLCWGLIIKNLALFQKMARRLTDGMPLYEPMMTQFTDAFMRIDKQACAELNFYFEIPYMNFYITRACLLSSSFLSVFFRCFSSAKAPITWYLRICCILIR